MSLPEHPEPRPVSYRLCVLTHGRSEPLEQTFRSFLERVTPEPASISIFADGAGTPVHVLDALAAAYGAPHLSGAERLTITHPSQQIGFCGATEALWRSAATAPEPYVFWLEHDFVFRRDVDLSRLAAVLRAEPHVAQMALYRESVNDDERAAGGYLLQHGDAYERRETWFGHGVLAHDEHFDYVGSTGYKWLETTRNWTTNPSLFRRDFAARNPWPLDEHCEGHFGFQVRDRHPGLTFGIWGDGTPDVEHVGVRTGFGY